MSASDDTVFYTDTYPVQIGSQKIELPLMPLDEEHAIALLMTIDMGVAFCQRVGEELAERFAPVEPEVIVCPATLGIPIAIEVSRALGLDRYVVVQKSPKFHLEDALAEEVTSVTSRGSQRLLLDRRHVDALQERRAVVIDDVVATGSSLVSTLRLVRRAHAEVVGVGVVLTEGAEWRTLLADDASLVRSLGHIPQFAVVDNRCVPIVESQ